MSNNEFNCNSQKKNEKDSNLRNSSCDLKLKICNGYWDYVLEHNHEPASVYSFCKQQEIQEVDFYKVYTSFNALVEEFWQDTVSETQALLESDQDYHSYDAKGKLLAFCYTYFENALKHRSKFISSFPRREKALFCPRLKKMRSVLEDAIKDQVLAMGWNMGALLPAKLSCESHRSSWFFFLFLVESWLQDSSEHFQDTDSLIEKTIRLSSEASHFPGFDAAIDLGKFLISRAPWTR